MVLAGLALPFATVVVGWRVADLTAAGNRDEAWWDAAGNWVYCALIAALVVAVLGFLPVARRIQHGGQLIFTVALGILYFVALFLFNLFTYFNTSGPFP